ncbi:hypothetical protein ACFOEP_12690 [Microbacterium amylolyticum]|uniref:hypothetical protein n=1 Tax=Microbacterium amylolyticum TaxID=936337 RepID=UPI003608A873
MFQATWAIVLTVTNIAGSAYAAQTVPPDVLGRAIGARRMLTMGSVPIAALGGGILADQAGILIPLIVWPSLTLVAAVAFLALSARTAETATAQAS